MRATDFARFGRSHCNAVILVEKKIGEARFQNMNPKVGKMQQLVGHDSTGGWEKCWEQGVTPWDLGRPTPVIVHLLQQQLLPKGRVLVPGCGSGHDVVELAGPERYVIGLDISDNAIEKAKESFSSSPKSNYHAFLKEDFFNWHPTELFDLIFDYTFFCAIEPSMRVSWARHVRDLLKPEGELITLMFPLDDRIGGPPYKVSVADYEEVLHPMGFNAISVEDNELAVGRRTVTHHLVNHQCHQSQLIITLTRGFHPHNQHHQVCQCKEVMGEAFQCNLEGNLCHHQVCQCKEVMGEVFQCNLEGNLCRHQVCQYREVVRKVFQCNLEGNLKGK